MWYTQQTLLWKSTLSEWRSFWKTFELEPPQSTIYLTQKRCYIRLSTDISNEFRKTAKKILVFQELLVVKRTHHKIICSHFLTNSTNLFIFTRDEKQIFAYPQKTDWYKIRIRCLHLNMESILKPICLSSHFACGGIWKELLIARYRNIGLQQQTFCQQPDQVNNDLHRKCRYALIIKKMLFCNMKNKYKKVK